MNNKKTSMPLEVRENMRGGNGAIRLQHLLQPEDSCGKLRLAAELLMKPGTSVGPHEHGPDAELYIITEGTLTVDDNGETVECTAGDIVFTGGGAFHSIANHSDSDVKLYAIVIN